MIHTHSNETMENMKLTNWKLAFCFGLIFFVATVATLPHYNTNYDAVNHLSRGQAYLHYLLTGKKDFSDLPPFKPYWQKPESLLVSSDTPKSEIVFRSVYQHDSTTYDYFIQNDGDGHPPLSDILSSVFNMILFQKLHFINDIDSYRIYGVLLASFLVGLVYWWSSRVYGRFAGIISVLSLSLYPLFWAHSHFNTEKDIPETVYFSFFIFSFWKAITAKSFKWMFISSVFFGLGLATKFNIIFSLPIVFLWLFTYLLSYSSKKNFQMLISTLMIPIVGIVIFVVSWPYMWQDPVAGIAKVFHFYKSIGVAKLNPQLLPFFGVNTYAAQTVLFTTPLIILFFVFLGIIGAKSKTYSDKNKTTLLFILWFLVPILRVSLPGSNIYGGVRQIMEYIPAMAILAGMGASFLLNRLRIYDIRFKAIFCIFTFAVLFSTLWRLHPYEEVYFNSLIGGLSGAKARDFPYWGETYGSPYRKAVEWIDSNALQGSKVVFAYELMPNIPRIFLRTDLLFSNTLRSGYLKDGEYAITLTSKGVDVRSYYDMYLETFLEPVYRATVDGVDILKVWKNDKAYLKVHLKENVEQKVDIKTSNTGILVNLQKSRKLSRLEIEYLDKNCKRLSNGIVSISQDGNTWVRLPGNLPDDWRISFMGEQPSKGKFIEPFVGQEAKFIRLDLSPKDTCLVNIKNARVYYFE